MNLPKSKFELEFNQGSVYGDEDREAVLRVFNANAPSCGSEVLAFEHEFAEFNNTKYAIAVGNGTHGLEIAFKAALEASSIAVQHAEVVCPTVSWISTASAAGQMGAKVIFADVVDPTVCADPESVKRLVTANTVAVVVVHLFGRPVDGLVELAAWLKERNICLIEDCCHAVGAVDACGALCGTIGDIGVFSFHQQKNMVTLGEGGMVVTSNAKLRELMIGYRSVCAMSYDPKGKYLALDSATQPMGNRYWLMDFADYGHNFRMIDMQAAVGRVQLRNVRKWNERRAEIAAALYNGLCDVPGLIVAPLAAEGKTVHAWHIFHVLITGAFPLAKEDFMWALLKDYGIKAWNHYCPMHLATCFRSRGLGSVGDCPVAEALFEQYVSLPVHPRLTSAAVDYMIDAIKEIAARSVVPRVTPNPLLHALVALSAPKKGLDLPHVPPPPVSIPVDAAGISSAQYDPVVQKQWDLFEPQVREAQREGLFKLSSLSSSEKMEIELEVSIARSPGRLDLMGGNDDYTGGLVFECTIAEATFVAAQVRPMSMSTVDSNISPEIVIRNRQLCEEDVIVPVAAVTTPNMNATTLANYLKSTFPTSRWQLYVVGVLLWLHMRYPEAMFCKNQGLSLLIWSQVPLNRGVSSSASVEVAVMKAAAHAFGISLSGEKLATACQWVENEVCSSACGLMDQMAVTLGEPFLAMRCQPATICPAPPMPSDLVVYGIDSGVSHEVSGIEYEAARAAAFMGYKILCAMEGLEVVEDSSGEILRYTDSKYNGYLANVSPSRFARCFEALMPETIIGKDFLDLYGSHVDPATTVLPDHIYHVRANTKYAVLENHRVTLFSQLLRGCGGNSSGDSSNGSDSVDKDTIPVYIQLGELMYQSHDAYTECGLGSSATSQIVELVQNLGPSSGLFGAKITGGGAGGTVAVLGLRSAAHTFQCEVVDAYARLRRLNEPPHIFVGSSPGADAFGIVVLK